MENINKLRTFNKLKSVYRLNTVEKRKESSAEHSWSCLMLADFFLTQSKRMDIDRLKVYELLMYHDVVEIVSGDTPMHPKIQRNDKDQDEKEQLAAELIKKSLPTKSDQKFIHLFHEFKDQKTIEARFAKAVDKLDAIIHELDYKEDWQGWTKEYLVGRIAKYFEEFPELKTAFNNIITYAEDNDYFDE